MSDQNYESLFLLLPLSDFPFLCICHFTVTVSSPAVEFPCIAISFALPVSLVSAFLDNGGVNIIPKVVALSASLSSAQIFEMDHRNHSIWGLLYGKIRGAVFSLLITHRFLGWLSLWLGQFRQSNLSRTWLNPSDCARPPFFSCRTVRGFRG